MNQMNTLKNRLLSLEKDIRVAVIGIGSTGKKLVYQLQGTPGMRPVAISDININKAVDCAQWLKLDYEIVHSLSDLNYAIQRGRVGITDKGELLAASALVHVMIESTNAVFQGALHAFKGIQNHQHVVMMNYEADMMYGPVLLRAAMQEGVVYTCADGDQSMSLKRMIDDLELLGLDIVMAGNIQNNLNRYADPITVAAEAEKKALDHKVYSYCADGTRLSVEMAVLANAINGRAAVPGMSGHRMKNVYEILNCINFDEIWDRKHPLMDYILGSEPKGGVFVVAHTADKFQQNTFDGFPPEMGYGPYYVFPKPYHFGHTEALHCVAEAYLDGTARLQPIYGIRTVVNTYAKRDLKSGDRLDGMGGFYCYGLIENSDDDEKNPGLPILLNENLKLKRAVAKDQRIGLEDVEFNADDKAFQLYFQALGKETATEPILVDSRGSALQYA